MKEREQRIAEIEARLAEATPGAWWIMDADQSEPLIVSEDADGKPSKNLPVVGFDMGEYGAEPCWQVAEPDARLIANAPSDIAWLLSELRTAEADLDETVRQRDAFGSDLGAISDGDVWLDVDGRWHYENGDACKNLDAALTERRNALAAASSSSNLSGEQTSG